MLTLKLFKSARLARTLSILFASLALLSAPHIGRAQSTPDDYPTKPVKIVVSFTAGGTTDVIARSVGQLLSEKFKQSFIVENRPGSGGNIGN